MICVGVSLRDLISMDPFRAILLSNPDLNAVLIDALNHSPIALKWPASNCDRFAHFQLLFLAASKASCWGFGGGFEVATWVLDV